MDQWEYRFVQNVTNVAQTLKNEGLSGWELCVLEPSSVQGQGPRRYDFVLKKRIQKNWELTFITIKASDNRQSIVEQINTIRRSIGNVSEFEIFSIVTESAELIPGGLFKAKQYRVFIKYRK